MNGENKTLENYISECIKRAENAGRGWLIASITCAVLALITAIPSTIYNINKYAYTTSYQKAKQIADVNNDGIVDDKEKEQWYKEMGLEPHVRPHTSELKEYIKEHEK